MTRPVTAQEAIRILDEIEESVSTDGMIGNLELGYLEAGLQEDGELCYRVTEAGRRRYEELRASGTEELSDVLRVLAATVILDSGHELAYEDGNLELRKREQS